MKKLIVTGCNGQLGRAINKELEGKGYEIVNTDVTDNAPVKLDITDVEQVLALAREVKPYAIINCAAHTNVNACETQWELAYKINAIGPRNLALAAKETGAKMIHVSTDYVFDGTATEPINEFQSTCPLGAYGKTKLEGENFVKQFVDRWFILRTAWLYGDGNNFAKTMLKLSESHDEVSVVADQFGTPTTAAELARAIAYLLPTENYGVFHATCEGSCSWADFASEVFKKAGKDTKVKYITTDEYPTPAKRPAYSVLDNYMFTLTTDFKFADWHDALDEYIETFVK